MIFESLSLKIIKIFQGIDLLHQKAFSLNFLNIMPFIFSLNKTKVIRLRIPQQTVTREIHSYAGKQSAADILILTCRQTLYILNSVESPQPNTSQKRLRLYISKSCTKCTISTERLSLNHIPSAISYSCLYLYISIEDERLFLSESFCTCTAVNNKKKNKLFFHHENNNNGKYR